MVKQDAKHPQNELCPDQKSGRQRSALGRAAWLIGSIIYITKAKEGLSRLVLLHNHHPSPATSDRPNTHGMN
jgi:hypothetical protein